MKTLPKVQTLSRPGGSEDVPFRSVTSRLIKGLGESAREAFQLDVLLGQEHSHFQANEPWPEPQSLTWFYGRKRGSSEQLLRLAIVLLASCS